MTNELSKSDKAVHREYIASLKERGFCKIDDESSRDTRLFNRKNGKTLPLPYLENNFWEWVRMNSRECDEFSSRYVVRSLRHVIGPMFVPRPLPFIEEPGTGCTYANTYRRYAPTIDDAEVSPLFHEFFVRLLPDEGERHTVLQWLAHMFQRPDERPSWHIMLTSEPGTGKGFLYNDILKPLLFHTTLIRNYRQVMGQFSTVLADNLFVLIDDAKAKSDATQTELKSLLTEEQAYVERKHREGGMVDTYCRFILASNEKRPLHLEASERRWFIAARIEHRHDPKETQAFIAKLAAWLKEPGSFDRVYNWFMRYSLEGFNYKSVPASAGLAAMVEMSRNVYADSIAEFVAESPVFTYAELVQGLRELGLTKLPGDRGLGHLIREAGFVPFRTKIDGKQFNLYRPKDMSEADARCLRMTEPAF